MAARILVVEDNPDNRTLLLDLLSSLEYEVIEGADGNEGVEKAKSEKPDLILMDLSLPQKDGWQATKELKANPETKDIPIIALTAHAMVGDKKRALEKLRLAAIKDTSNIDAYLKIGDILRENGKVENAIKIHRQLTVRKGLSGP